MELAALAPPGPDRAFEVGGVDDHAEEAVFLDRIVRRADLQRHLVVGAQVDGLHVAARAQIPEMEPVAVFVGEQVLGHDAVLELRRQPPFAGHHVVARQVPPEIVVLLLRPAVDLPAADHVEGFAVHDEDARRPVGAVRAAAAQGGDVDALRPAMDGVRARIAGLPEHLLRLDDLVDRWPPSGRGLVSIT